MVWNVIIEIMPFCAVLRTIGGRDVRPTTFEQEK